MRPRQRARLMMVGLIAGLGSAAVGLVLVGLDSKVDHFYSITRLVEAPPKPDERVRIGGLVLAGSVSLLPDGTNVFALTDGAQEASVLYKGILPDLFREGQGIVAEGAMSAQGRFVASRVLAKHDENYIPKEVQDSLKAQGVWRGQDGPGDRAAGTSNMERSAS